MHPSTSVRTQTFPIPETVLVLDLQLAPTSAEIWRTQWYARVTNMLGRSWVIHSFVVSCGCSFIALWFCNHKKVFQPVLGTYPLSGCKIKYVLRAIFPKLRAIWIVSIVFYMLTIFPAVTTIFFQIAFPRYLARLSAGITIAPTPAIAVVWKMACGKSFFGCIVFLVWALLNEVEPQALYKTSRSFVLILPQYHT